MTVFEARNSIKIGDKFTLSGCYKRRSFFEWLRNKPKELRIYTIISDNSSDNSSYQQYVEKE